MIFKLVFRYLQRNSVRSAGAVISTCLSAFIYVVLISVPTSIRTIIRESQTTLRLVVQNRTSNDYGVPARYCRSISTIRGVIACSAVTSWDAVYQDPTDLIGANAVDSEIGALYPEYQITKDAEDAMRRTMRGALVGHFLMQKEHWHVGQLVSLRGVDSTGLDLDFIVLGEIPNRRYPNNFVFRRDYLKESWKAFGYGEFDQVLFLLVRVGNPNDVSVVSAKIDESFKDSDYQTRTTTESDALSTSLSILGNLESTIKLISAAVLLTMLLISSNSIALNVRERIVDFAVMRTLGFSPYHILEMLLVEWSMVAVVGSAVGTGVAFIMFNQGVALRSIMGNYGYFVVSASGAVNALIVVTATVILSGLVPAYEALTVAPATAIRAVV
jgi:putative ABC transport system permease protein